MLTSCGRAGEGEQEPPERQQYGQDSRETGRGAALQGGQTMEVRVRCHRTHISPVTPESSSSVFPHPFQLPPGFPPSSSRRTPASQLASLSKEHSHDHLSFPSQ